MSSTPSLLLIIVILLPLMYHRRTLRAVKPAVRFPSPTSSHSNFSPTLTRPPLSRRAEKSFSNTQDTAAKFETTERPGKQPGSLITCETANEARERKNGFTVQFFSLIAETHALCVHDTSECETLPITLLIVRCTTTRSCSSQRKYPSFPSSLCH
jgi:hypothetical protein